MFVTVNYDDEGRPFEVFAILGKAGSTESAALEAISRLTTMALRAGVDPNKIIEHLKGITDEPVWDAGRLVRSAPDAVALVLGRHLSLEGTPSVEDVAASEGKSTAQLELLAAPAQENGNGHSSVSSVRCPECSVGTLVHQEGCLRCPECGYNKCE